MDCPACSKELPFYFAFVSGLGKQRCPSCSESIKATRDSFTRVQKFSVILSFFAGIPLGIVCSYISIAMMQLALGLIVFGVGIIAVLTSAYLYGRSTLKFELFGSS